MLKMQMPVVAMHETLMYGGTHVSRGSCSVDGTYHKAKSSYRYSTAIDSNFNSRRHNPTLPMQHRRSLGKKSIHRYALKPYGCRCAELTSLYTTRPSLALSGRFPSVVPALFDSLPNSFGVFAAVVFVQVGSLNVCGGGCVWIVQQATTPGTHQLKYNFRSCISTYL